MNDNMLINLGKNIKSFRELNKLSQHQLAKLINTSHVAICKWEQGKADPTTTNLVALSNVFKISLDELINTNNENFKNLFKFTKIEKKFFEVNYIEEQDKILIEIKK